jgi:hypothetical protein
MYCTIFAKADKLGAGKGLGKDHQDSIHECRICYPTLSLAWSYVQFVTGVLYLLLASIHPLPPYSNPSSFPTCCAIA